MGEGGDGVEGGRAFPILYISTPDQPPHGGVTGSSSKKKWHKKPGRVKRNGL